ncbi:MAG TPA: DUF2219 family protein, partial [Phnomibacter sp.]|nr:DUF2219 family protein [Phnomibacter sp.]
TGAQAGLLLRLGRPEEYDRSLHWGSRTAAHAAQGPRHPSELYFFMHPSLHYQLYNATLQGGLFRHDKGPKTVPIEPLYVSNQIGFGYAQNRWTLMMYLVTRGRMAKTQLRTERFISIKLSYRFAEGGKTSHTTH